MAASSEFWNMDSKMIAGESVLRSWPCVVLGFSRNSESVDRRLKSLRQRV